MAVGHLTYLDLDPETRRAGAAEFREKMRGILATPFLTPQQVAAVQDKLATLDAWEQGAIPVESPGAGEEAPPRKLPRRKPQHHVIEVGEGIPVDDTLKSR